MRHIWLLAVATGLAIAGLAAAEPADAPPPAAQPANAPPPAAQPADAPPPASAKPDARPGTAEPATGEVPYRVSSVRSVGDPGVLNAALPQKDRATETRGCYAEAGRKSRCK